MMADLDSEDRVGRVYLGRDARRRSGEKTTKKEEEEWDMIGMAYFGKQRGQVEAL